MNTPEPDIKADVERIGRIKIVPTILEIICRTTGMGFAAVARVTEEKWVACEVRDEIRFGLMPGGELALDTTICNEIRLDGQAVIIDHVSEDEVYRNHHTPLMYGFQSYISVPIVDKQGKFFGTLCAIDPKPSLLNNTEIVGMFKTYANLVSFYLNIEDQLIAGEMKLLEDIIVFELEELRDTAAAREQSSHPRSDKDLSAAIRQSTATVMALIENLVIAYQAKKVS